MELELIRIFVKVAQNGSFSRAAEILRIPKSTVSKAVSRLERETGTTLLMRTTRSLALTQAGRALYEASLGPLLQLEEAHKALSGQDDVLTGLVRITAPEDLGSYVVAPALVEVSRQHPGLRFEVEATNAIVDLVGDGFDLAVRIGRLGDSRLRLKKAGDVSLVPVASPAYLKEKGKIRDPADLRGHDCLSLDYEKSTERWTLRSAEKTVHIEVQTKIAANQMTSLLRTAIAGGGVALVPSYMAQDSVAAGDLVRLLPDWRAPGIPVSVITPLAPSSSARLKLTVDHLHGALKKALAV